MPANEKNGILFPGTQTHLFNYCPSAFSMVINDYYFFNASNNNLISPRVGFPGLANVKPEDTSMGTLSAKFIKGRNKITNPVIQTFIPGKESITFYQPIYKQYLTSQNFPINDYVVEHSYDKTAGLGGVFVQKGNVGNTKYLKPDDTVCTKLKAIPVPNLASDVLKFQNAIQSKNIVSSQDVLFGVKLNNMMLESMKKQK